MPAAYYGAAAAAPLLPAACFRCPSYYTTRCNLNWLPYFCLRVMNKSSRQTQRVKSIQRQQLRAMSSVSLGASAILYPLPQTRLRATMHNPDLNLETNARKGGVCLAYNALHVWPQILLLQLVVNSILVELVVAN